MCTAPGSCAPLARKRGAGGALPSYSRADPHSRVIPARGPGGGGASGCARPGFLCPPCAQTGGRWRTPFLFPRGPHSHVTPARGPGGGGAASGFAHGSRFALHLCAQSANGEGGPNGEGGAPSHFRAASRLRVAPAPKPGVWGFARGPRFACPLCEGWGAQRRGGAASGFARAPFASPLCARGEGGRRFPFPRGPPICVPDVHANEGGGRGTPPIRAGSPPLELRAAPALCSAPPSFVRAPVPRKGGDRAARTPFTFARASPFSTTPVSARLVANGEHAEKGGRWLRG